LQSVVEFVRRMTIHLVVGTHKGVHTNVARDAATGMRTEAITDDEHETLQAALTGLGGIGKGVVVLLVLTTTAILAGGKVLLLKKGGVCEGLGDKNGSGVVGRGWLDVVGDHSVLNWKEVVL
jgi:hypothetical protein